MSNKISIRFYNNQPVRAIWDDDNSKWWFSVLDIVAIFNAQNDYAKTRNYWKYLKNKLKNDAPQLVSATNRLKLKAHDGKLRLTDVLDAEGVSFLAKLMPNNKGIGFLDWFDEIMDKYVEMNVAHPFMEGNGRSTRIWLDLMLKRALKKCVDWSRIDKNEYLDAMRESVSNSQKIKSLVEPALTGYIDDREMFMKGIDYSYYYEQND